MKKLKDHYLDLCAELFYRTHHLELTWEDAKDRLGKYNEYKYASE